MFLSTLLSKTFGPRLVHDGRLIVVNAAHVLKQSLPAVVKTGRLTVVNDVHSVKQ